MYPSEGIHRRWDNGYRITATAATWDQAAFVLSVPRRKPADETQETLRTSAFPSTHVKVDYLHYFLFFSFFFCLFLVLELVFVFKFNIYIWWFLTGEMGKKSLHCISLLWSDCFLSWQSFIRMFTEVIFDCSCIQAVSLLLPSMPCLQNPNLSRSKTGHHGSWALMYAKLYLIVTITLHLLLTPVHCLSIVSKCFQANVYSIWMGLFYLLLKRLYSLEQ